MSPTKLRPRLESLEGRMLLSAANSPITSFPTPLNFAVPGTTAQLTTMWGPAVYNGGVHALASQQADSVTLTLMTRQAIPPRESLQVEVATGPSTDPSSPVPSAQPGVQYRPIRQTITFPPGVRSMPVTIPIVAGAANPGLLSFQVTVTQLGVTANTLGTGRATEEVFLARDVNNASVPRIDGAYMIVRGRRTSDLVLHFSRPMDPASVQNINAYLLQDSTYHEHPMPLFGPWGPNITNSRTVLKKAIYDPSTNTVDLHLARSVDARDALQIDQSALWFGQSQSFGQNDPLLRDAAGMPINEDGSGFGGGFLITLTNKKATIVDGITQSVIPATPPRL